MLIDTIVDNNSVTDKFKGIIKFIDKHGGIVDKIFQEIYDDLKNQGYDIDKTDTTINIKLKESHIEDRTESVIYDCVKHHTYANIPARFHATAIIFLFRIVILDKYTIQVIRKR